MFKHLKLYKVACMSLLGLTFFCGMVFGEAVGFKNKTDASFVVFYEDITNDNINIIATYDIAVLEPKGTNDDFNSFLKKKDTILFGYMSTLEIEYYDDYKIDRMTDDMYLIVDGKRVYIDKYKNYLGDIRNKKFRQLLLDSIGNRIVDKNYDGVFLDTVDYTEYFDDAVLNASLQEGYIVFLEELVREFPELKVFQNRGFKSYLLGADKYVDYLLYEDFRYDRFISSDYYKELAFKLSSSAEANDALICALAQRDDEENERLASMFGWLYYFSSYESNYTEVIEPAKVVTITDSNKFFQSCLLFILFCKFS